MLTALVTATLMSLFTHDILLRLSFDYADTRAPLLLLFFAIRYVYEAYMTLPLYVYHCRASCTDTIPSLLPLYYYAT